MFLRRGLHPENCGPERFVLYMILHLPCDSNCHSLRVVKFAQRTHHYTFCFGWIVVACLCICTYIYIYNIGPGGSSSNIQAPLQHRYIFVLHAICPFVLDHVYSFVTVYMLFYHVKCEEPAGVSFI